MKAFVAVTDNDWFHFLSRQSEIDEVNFWSPSGKPLKRFMVGEPVLFKLHYPEHYVTGGGFFASFARLPADFAWDAFGVKNGAGSLSQMRERIAKYLVQKGVSVGKSHEIGCTVLIDPFFLPRHAWIAPPADLQKAVQRGKTYDLRTSPGTGLWEQVLGARGRAEGRVSEATPFIDSSVEFAEAFVRQRLGQGSFRVMVADAYERRCAVSDTRTLPALIAAHIRPVAQGGGHRLDNGLLLRSDIHALYDRGYVTVTPDLEFRASRRLKDDFDNGEEYRQLAGRRILVPRREVERPSREHLEWHADTVFLG